MVFLQKNGLSDCGKGQIIGQASLLQEYLKEEEQQENKQYSTDKSSQQQKEQQEKQQAITKDADKVGRMMKSAFRENAVNNYSKSDLLRQVGSVIDKAKHTVEQNKERGIEGPNNQAGQILPEPLDATTEDGNKSQQQIGGLGTNKEKNQSWINKIKKVTEVENWQSWQ